MPQGSVGEECRCRGWPTWRQSGISFVKDRSAYRCLSACVLRDQSLHRVQLSVTPWIVARQAPPSMGISRHEYWSGWPCSSPGDLPDPGIEPWCPASQWILHHLSPQGSPRIQKWGTYSFSKGSSQPRNRTKVSCTAGRFFTSWATRKAHNSS